MQFPTWEEIPFQGLYGLSLGAQIPQYISCSSHMVHGFPSKVWLKFHVPPFFVPRWSSKVVQLEDAWWSGIFFWGASCWLLPPAGCLGGQKQASKPQVDSSFYTPEFQLSYTHT